MRIVKSDSNLKLKLTVYINKGEILGFYIVSNTSLGKIPHRIGEILFICLFFFVPLHHES